MGNRPPLWVWILGGLSSAVVLAALIVFVLTCTP